MVGLMTFAFAVSGSPAGIGLASGASAASKDEAVAALKHNIKSYIGVSASIKVHDAGGIPRSEGKAQRVVDKRG